MPRRILAILGTGAMVVGFTSAVYAKPISTSHPQTGNVTRSSESLQGVSSRDITDYPGLSPSSPESQSNIPNTPITQTPHSKTPALFRKFGDRVKIDTGDTIGPGRNGAEPLRINQQNGEYDTNFEAQYKLSR